jgi:hypothetical protein
MPLTAYQSTFEPPASHQQLARQCNGMTVHMGSQRSGWKVLSAVGMHGLTFSDDGSVILPVANTARGYVPNMSVLTASAVRARTVGTKTGLFNTHDGRGSANAADRRAP